MNVVATSLEHPRAAGGVPDRDRRGDARRPAARDDPPPLPAHRRQARASCSATGCPPTFSTEYYGARRLRAGARCLAADARALLGVCGGPVHPQAVSPLRRARCTVDGKLLEQNAFVGLMARRRCARWASASSSSIAPTTIRSVSACWPFTRAALSLTLDLLGGARAGAASRRSAPSAPWPRSWTSHRTTAAMAYTIDGDLYRTQTRLAIIPRAAHRVRQAALCVDCRARAAIPWAASHELLVSVWTGCGCGSRETRTWA